MQRISSDSTKPISGREHDASRKEVALYAVGNMEGGIANQFFPILNTLTVVVLGMNPLIIGLIISLKTLWDAVTDPIMAQITDNASTRWGRRIPFILTGGILRVLFLLAVFVFFPRDATIKPNSQLQGPKDSAAMVEVGKSAEAGRAVGEGTAAATIQEVPATPSRAPSAPPRGLWQKIQDGYAAFVSAENAYHRHVAVYLLVASLIYALLSTIQSVPYYALGIELCPSYNGRTRVVVARAYVEKLMGFAAPWVLPFIFLPFFPTAIDGLIGYALIVCAVGIPTTVAMCIGIKEKQFHPDIKRPPAPPFFRSMWLTAKNPHFLKILFLYVFIGFTNGIFAQVTTFLVLFWVFSGNILQGSIVNGYAATVAAVLTFATLPLVQWACSKLGKHRALRWAIVWMSLGGLLKWVLLNPHYPYLQLLLPFFFSVGIASVHTILPSLMADVTDIDELETGVRREGMFGAVMAFLTKALTSLQPLLAAGVLVASGFDASLGAAQPEEVFTRMRVLASFVPAFLLVFALIALIRYPLTATRMAEVKAILAERRAQAEAS